MLLEKYRDTPPISTVILLQKHAVVLAQSSMYTSLFHGTDPICIAMLLQNSLEHAQCIFPKKLC